MDTALHKNNYVVITASANVNNIVKKNKTHTEYIRRINKAIEYIANNIDQNIRLENIAEASHFSPYHFHRIFHGFLGETVNDYVSRKKMEKTANTLMCRLKLSITEVAEMGGFSSNANSPIFQKHSNTTLE